MVSGLVLKYPNGEHFVIRRGYETARPVSSSFCLTVPLAEFLRRCDQAELNAYDDLGTVRQAQNASLRLLERRAKRLGASEPEIRRFMLEFLDGAF